MGTRVDVGGIELNVEIFRPGGSRPEDAPALPGLVLTSAAGATGPPPGTPSAETPQSSGPSPDLASPGRSAAALPLPDRSAQAALPVEVDVADECPLLLVHGIGGSAEEWSDVASELASALGRTVVAYDHRGHGRSGRAPGRSGYSLDQLTADLAALIDRLGLAPLHLLGHSMGGVVSLRYTLDHPDAVRSLLLVDTAAAPAAGVESIWRHLGMLALTDGMAAVSALIQKYAGSHEFHGRQVRAFVEMDPVAFSALGHDLCSYPSLVGRLGEIRCPVTVIVGERDDLLRDAAQVMAAAIPGAHAVVIAGADHNPQFSRTPALETAVERHFATLPPPAVPSPPPTVP